MLLAGVNSDVETSAGLEFAESFDDSPRLEEGSGGLITHGAASSSFFGAKGALAPCPRIVTPCAAEGQAHPWSLQGILNFVEA